ncbi:MAG: TRAM domain-containing protein, partial [Anaerolineae bacterium]|nr:TRAM domain-containing protein [Anaerolineae bacterium]
GYTVAEYRTLVEKIRARLPYASIATDVIVGMPGETEAQFRATYDLLAELQFDMVHVAMFSPRPNTVAARWDDDVPPDEKERRRKAIDALQADIVGKINARYLGQIVEVLVEEKAKHRWKGRTRTNKLVFFEDDTRDWRGKLARVKIEWTGPWSMIGTVVDAVQRT